MQLVATPSSAHIAAAPQYPEAFAKAAIKFGEAADALTLDQHARQDPNAMMEIALTAASAGVDLLDPYVQEESPFYPAAEAAVSAAITGSFTLTGQLGKETSIPDLFAQASKQYRAAQQAASGH